MSLGILEFWILQRIIKIPTVRNHITEADINSSENQRYADCCENLLWWSEPRRFEVQKQQASTHTCVCSDEEDRTFQAVIFHISDSKMVVDKVKKCLVGIPIKFFLGWHQAKLYLPKNNNKRLSPWVVKYQSWWDSDHCHCHPQQRSSI